MVVNLLIMTNLYLKLIFVLIGFTLVKINADSSVNYFETTVHLGILVDFEDDITKGIRNDTLLRLVDDLRGTFTNNLTISADLIQSYETFETSVEDDPKNCEKYIGLISALPCSSTKELYSLINEHCSSTLLISIHNRNCVRPSRDHGIGFPVLSSIDHVIPMLIDMRHDFLRKWDHVDVIHDQSIDFDALHDLVDGLSKIHGPEITPSTVTTYHFGQSSALDSSKRLSIDEDNSKEEKTLISWEISRSIQNGMSESIVDHISGDDSHKYFIVIARSGLIKELIELANNRSLLMAPRKWLLIFSDNQEDPGYWAKLGPILATSGIAIVTRETSEYGQCNDLTEGCQMRLALETLHSALAKVASSTDYDFTDTDMKRRTRNRILSEMRLLLGSSRGESDSSAISGRYCGNCDRFVLQSFEIVNQNNAQSTYRRRPYPTLHWIEHSPPNGNDVSVQVTQTGEWTPFKGLLQESDPLPSDAVNGGGRVLKMGVVNQRPLINVELVDGKCEVNGTTFEILKLISSRMNFTIQWVCWSDVNSIGVLKSDGSWDGLLGKLAKGEIDVAANGIWKTPSRLNSGKFEFLFPYDVDAVSLMVAKMPEDEKFLFICPFTYDTWAVVILCLIVIGPIFWIVHKSAIYYDYYNLNDGKGFFNLGSCIWYCYGAMVQQGGDILPTAISGRILIAFWWLFVIVTVTTYSGNLVALLTFPKVIQPIQTAEDLKNTWGMSWGVSTPGALSEMIQVIQYSGLETLRDGMKYYNFEREKYEIFDDVSSGRLGFIMSEYEARYWVSAEFVRTEYCGMHVTKNTLYRTPIHMVAKKDLLPPTFIKEFSRQIFVMARAGISSYWRLWFQTPGNDCMYPSIVHAGDVKKVDAIHMIGSYLLLAWGFGVGLLVLISELVHKKYIRKQDHRRSPDQGKATDGMTEMFRSMYTRFNSNPSYSKWASNIEYPGVQGQADPKSTKLSFIHPQIKSDLGKSSLAAATANNAAPASGPVRRPKAAAGNLYFDQQGPIYTNQIRGIYNDPEHYQYYSYDSSKAGYKPKL